MVKKLIKKIITALLMTFLFISCFESGYKAYAVMFEELETRIIITNEGLEFERNTGVILGYKNGDSRIDNLVIPEEINGERVISIGEGAFERGGNFDKVTIPKTITSIGYNAFTYSGVKEINVNEDNNYYSSINGVLFSKDKTKIIRFQNNDNEGYTIPEGVITIEKGAFSNTTIKNLSLPESLENIQNENFERTMIEQIYIPKNVSYIEEGTFKNSNISEISISKDNENFTAQDNVIFNKNKDTLISYLDSKIDESYTIPNTVKIIEPYAFFYNYRLRNIEIPEGVTTIKERAFSHFDYLKELKIPESVNYIGDYAFESLMNVSSINIPKNVNYIGKNPFTYCQSLNKITVDTNNSKYKIVDDALIDNENFKLIAYPTAIKSNEYKVPDSIKIIGEEAFYGCKISNINLPYSLEKIENYGFAYTDANSINLPEKLKYIGEYGLANYKGNLLELPKGIEYIGEGAFSSANFTSIVIPETVSYIGDKAFNYCENLEEISVDQRNQYYTSADGILYNIDKSILYKYPEGKEDTEYDIPNTMLRIGKGALANSKIISISIPNSVRYIGLGALWGSRIKNFNVKGALAKEEFDQYKNSILFNSTFYPEDEITFKFIAREDINGDGKLDLLDLSTVANSYNTILDKDSNDNIDINEDGSIDIYDIIRIARLL